MNKKRTLSQWVGILVILGFLFSAFGGAANVHAGAPPMPPADDGASAQSLAWTRSGMFSIVWGDSADGKSQETYFLTDDDGVTTALIIGEATAQSLGGVLSFDRKRVTVQGASLAPLANGTPAAQVSSLALVRAPNERKLDSEPIVSGPNPWVSIMCKFSDKTEEPKNLAYFQNMYANSYPGLDHYWRQVSYDTANIAGSGAFGWFTLPQPASYYNPSGTGQGTNLSLLATDCINVANPSVNFSLYTGINMMFNFDFDYGWAWGGSRYMTLDGVTKTWSTTWEPPWGYSSITVMSHEMGHGFGLPHSSGAYGQTYDNRWDVMSDTWTDCANSTDPTYGCLGQHTISYHKDRLGWIPSGQKYMPPGGTTTITLEQLALPQTSAYKMAQIPIGGSSTHFYTVEARLYTGYDVKLPGQAVIIHEVDTTRGRPAYVVDPDGNGNTGDAGAQWGVGETFTDAANGIAVSVLSATPTGFVVSITAPALSQPDLVIESISVLPANPAPNQSATYTVRVRNQGAANVTSSFWVDLFVNVGPSGDCSDVGVKYWSVASLAAGAYQDLTTTMSLAAGTHSLLAMADSNCYISESDETDNVIGPIFVTVANPTATFSSVALYDGGILESSETSNIGSNSLSSTLPTFNVGDNGTDRQIRGILSFNTASIPNTAVITKVTLKIKQQGVMGTNPFTTHGNLLVDIIKGAFSGSLTLQATDFQAAASKMSVGAIPKTPSGGWYTKVWTSGIFSYINKTGSTQLRLRFSKDDNDDNGADYILIHSGNATNAADRPTLIVEYYIP